jgi:acyl carrier protein
MALDHNETASRIRAIIAEQLGISKDSVTEASNLESLGADSLDRVKIIMELEEAFGIEIKDEEAEKLASVGQVIDYVHSLTN